MNRGVVVPLREKKRRLGAVANDVEAAVTTRVSGVAASDEIV